MVAHQYAWSVKVSIPLIVLLCHGRVSERARDEMDSPPSPHFLSVPEMLCASCRGLGTPAGQVH